MKVAISTEIGSYSMEIKNTDYSSNFFLSCVKYVLNKSIHYFKGVGNAAILYTAGMNTKWFSDLK